MARQTINHGSVEGDGTGESPFSGMQKVNANFTELYAAKDAQATALNAKAPLDNPTFTGTVNGISKAMVGLGNADNTPDATKPTSIPQQASIDLGDKPRLVVSDVFDDFVASGLDTPTSANLIAVTTPGVAYVNGKRVVKLIGAGDLTFTYLATRDTYLDIDENGIISRTAVVNGAAAPAIPANNLRLDKVVTDADKVTTVTRITSQVAIPTIVTSQSTGAATIGSPSKRYQLKSDAYLDAQKWLSKADYGTLVTNLANAAIVANGTPVSGTAGVVTTGLPPIKTPVAVRLIGHASTRASMTSQFSAAQATDVSFKGIAFWAKVKGRSAGPVMAQIFVGATSDPYTGKAIALTTGLPADGKWHLVYVPRLCFQMINGFVLGTDTITSIGIRDRNDAANLGYPGMLTNAEELQLGPVYLNPWSRPKFLIRFDDSLQDALVPNGTFTADGVTQAWSYKTLLDQYGFGAKGSMFHLTRRFNTSNSSRTFLTTAQLATLAGYGWSHCAQTHQDPADGANNGIRLMGPMGYAAKTIASVDTSADTLVASAAHNVSNGYWGYPVVFAGTDLPEPLVVGTVYWARQVTNTTTMTLHPTENDSIANTNKIDLTTTGTPANFTYRYGYSANDGTLQQADLQNAINTLTGLGYGNTAKIWAPNQGALDKGSYEAARTLGIEMILGVSDAGTGGAYPRTRHPHMETTGASVGGAYPVTLDTLYGIQSAIQTDGAPTAADVEAYVEGIAAAGGIGQNYHHTLTAVNGPVLAAYLNALRTKVLEGTADVVTAEELRDYLAAAKQLTPGVVY